MKTIDSLTDSKQSQMKKGSLEFAILLIIAKQKVYASEIIESLKKADLIIVEGTLYPLLSRIKNAKLIDYSWEESLSGPPRKYYTLTKRGQELLQNLNHTWQSLSKSINTLIGEYEKSN